MNSFYNKYVIISQFLRMRFILSPPGLEVKNREINLLAIEKTPHIIIKFLDVDCLKAFKVVIAVRISRRMFPVNKIIIYRNGMRL